MTRKNIEAYLKFIGAKNIFFIEADKLYLHPCKYTSYQIIHEYFEKNGITPKNFDVAVVIREVYGNTITEEDTGFIYLNEKKDFEQIGEMNDFSSNVSIAPITSGFSVKKIFDGIDTDDDKIIDRYITKEKNLNNNEAIVINKVGYSNIYCYESGKFILVGTCNGSKYYEKMDGKKVASIIKNNIKSQVKQMHKKPTLAIISVGEDPASEIYMKGKKNDCIECGFDCMIVSLAETASFNEIASTIKDIGDDDSIDGMILQLPLPGKMNAEVDRLVKMIPHEKDVDCFNPINVGDLYVGNPYMLPCTPAGVIELLKYYNINCDGKKCVIINRSNLVGKPLAALMTQRNCTVTLCHSHTENLADETREADILITAIGKEKFITADMIKEGAVVIDIGITRGEDGKVHGDVDFDSVAPKTSYITPVPGGTGPMTRAMLMQNTLNAAIYRKFHNHI